MTEGPAKKLQYISFGAFEEDLPSLKARIEAAGVKLLDPPPGFDSDGLWFCDPDGILVEVKVAPKSSPNQKSSFEMDSVHGSDHHLIAFAKSSAPGLHHCSWDVPSVNDVGLGAMQMADKGFSAGWGLGRHVLGSNYFHYVRDPWGSYCEYSSDIDYIPVTCNWDASDHPPEDSFYLWGPEPPKDFVTNYEAGGAPPAVAME